MWRFELRTPDGRVMSYASEHAARGACEAFNRHIPRGAKLARVVTLPTFQTKQDAPK
jgi:hypothetical protein